MAFAAFRLVVKDPCVVFMIAVDAPFQDSAVTAEGATNSRVVVPLRSPV